MQMLLTKCNDPLHFSGPPTGQQPPGGVERTAEHAAPPAVAERVAQPAAVVRLRLHPQVPPVAQPEEQPDRGVGQLLRHAGRLQARPPGRRGQPAAEDRPGVPRAQLEGGEQRASELRNGSGKKAASLVRSFVVLCL